MGQKLNIIYFFKFYRFFPIKITFSQGLIELEQIIKKFDENSFIDLKGDGRYSPNRRLAYKYTIDSWKKWCDRNDCELVVLDEALHTNDVMRINYHRYYAFDINEILK